MIADREEESNARIDMSPKSEQFPVAFETLTIRQEGGVLFAEIAAPPMNLLGPELVRDLVSLIGAPRPTTRSGCSCSRAPIPSISSPKST
jgi:hypothetical protein